MSKTLTKKPSTTKIKTRYLSGGMPKAMRKGFKYLCHNHITRDVDTRPDVRGFRAWWATKPPEGFVPCKCGWSGLPHYSAQGR